jgi:hypothetical protein
MRHRLHWGLTIAALAVAVVGSTPFGGAAVDAGVRATKAPLTATGLSARGRRGPRGPRGRRGPAGPKGDAGPPGSRGTAVVAHIQSTGSVTTPADVPLTGNTWTQAAAEDDVIFGRITYQAGPVCTNASGPELSVLIYVDGVYMGSRDLNALVTPGETRMLPGATYVFAPGADTSHTLAARVVDGCNEQFTVTDLRLTVTPFT